MRKIKILLLFLPFSFFVSCGGGGGGGIPGECEYYAEVVCKKASYCNLNGIQSYMIDSCIEVTIESLENGEDANGVEMNADRCIVITEMVQKQNCSEFEELLDYSTANK